MKERLLAFWYQPAPAARLALLRIAFGVFATFYLGPRLGALSNVASLQDWQFEPVGLVWFLARPLPKPIVLGAVVAALALAPAVRRESGCVGAQRWLVRNIRQTRALSGQAAGLVLE